MKSEELRSSLISLLENFEETLKRDDIREKVIEYRKATGYNLSYRIKGKSFEIAAEGISAHGATPAANDAAHTSSA